MEIKRIEDARPYKAPKHFKMIARRLQGLEATGAESCSVGFSTFEPGGGAEASATPFEKIYVSSEIGMRKPDAHAYRWVVDDMRTVPERVLFLDDNAENITGAQDVGLKTVHVRAADDAVAAIDVFLNR